jgi:polar amino acid transport system substrate-binding protein
VILSSLLLSGISAANASASTVESENQTTIPLPINIAIRRDVAPYVTDNANAGLEIEILDAIFNQTNYQAKFVQLPRIRMVQMFGAKQVEGVVTQNIDVSGDGCITDWYISHRNVGLSEASRNISFKTLDDMGNMSVISFSGAKQYLGPEFADQAQRSPRYIESSDQKMHISLLYFGYFDAAIGDEWILKLAQANIAEETGTYKDLRIHPVMPQTNYAARFRSDVICRAFNDGLATIRKNGTYEKLLKRFLAKIENQLVRARTVSIINSPEN